MGRYFVKRVLSTIPLLLVISILIFAFIHLIPGDPVRKMLPKEATQEEYEQLKEELGFNDPLPVQYINYMKGIFHGDFGESYKNGLPISEIFPARLKATLTLTLWAILWSVVLGTLIGIVSAVKRGKFLDYAGMVIATSGISVPSFWLGLMLIQIFSVKLGWLPTGQLDSWKGYILPAITMGCSIMGTLARYSRSSMLETMQEDYVRTARAKGQRESLVVLRHAFRNSLVQVVTVVGLQIGGLLAGSVLVETVFSIPGLGRLMVDSINFRDYKVIQALLMFFAVEYIVINLIVDLLYGVLNPKIRYD
ncbi:glutathione ABC transporter permease GsiC [Flavonifractor sp. An92]|uniref:ABC transporter permease n=1 Tax=Flavonifractor sp. An92 TaxID=1965666 RepID=UPI000B370C4C|nr:ABC transporter permease [Flavonifractor sp. An92]OUN05931.1 glutathione ABC transporter permease GsiC [Flavonifractor sp. An92]